MFYSDTFPQIIQSLWLSKGKMLSGFAIGHPGQRRVSLLVYAYNKWQSVCKGMYLNVQPLSSNSFGFETKNDKKKMECRAFHSSVFIYERPTRMLCTTYEA